MKKRKFKIKQINHFEKEKEEINSLICDSLVLLGIGVVLGTIYSVIAIRRNKDLRTILNVLVPSVSIPSFVIISSFLYKKHILKDKTDTPLPFEEAEEEKSKKIIL